MTRVVLALERCAKTDPPAPLRDVPTSQGQGYFYEGTWYVAGDSYSREVMASQPSVWYDLRPTEGEGVTVEDIKAVLVNAANCHPYAREAWGSIARLRAALDALNRSEEA